MAKKKPSDRLKVLLRLAEMKEQNAARRLAADSERLQQAQEQGRQLALYEKDYQQGYVDRGAQALTRQNLLNYQGFFRQLEQVQTQQQRTIEHRDHEREAARQQWVEQYSRRKLLMQIRERRLAVEQMKAEKKFQAELDDRTAQRLRAQAEQQQDENP